ncbi:aldo/keto reductase [Aureimonas leprariae]|uniref:Oxidoreductase n=1 Tax=Plantimonas leprariae TaxID=2615207 RepID=A0A7V7TWC6_9HYPH|nr:aldo/keto reductase [Aureimonas leprariae]KAB0679381.1 oxidoreductase [Aureimonas leprariae]
MSNTASGTGRLAWGILGTGAIAKVFADALPQAANARLVAVGTRGQATPELEQRFPGARIVSGYDALLADPEVEAVYIATPHPSHAMLAIRAAEAGKHVLCEKPFAVNAAEAEAAFAAARRAGTFAGEAFMYRFHPQIEALVELIRAGEIGEVGLVRSTFGFAGSFAESHRLLADEHAGGGILDVGSYAMSMARLVAGAASGKPFADPVKVSGAGRLGTTGADLVAVASLSFADGVVAQLSCSVALNQDNTVEVRGTKGRITLLNPWMAGGKSGEEAVLVVEPNGAEARRISVPHGQNTYAREIEAVGEAVRAGATEYRAPGMSQADTLGNLRALDAWRASIGQSYSFERVESARPPLAGRPVRFERTGTIPTRAMPGVEHPVSAVALGLASFTSATQAFAVMDAYFEAGGALFDTSAHYGANGLADRHLGAWIDSRGVRKEVSLIAKGAHTPLCYPDVIGRQLGQSLERLKTDHTEIYMMHRDNEDVPVSEFVDAIASEIRAGRVGAYGFSNWTLPRFDAARAYARDKGLPLPTALSNNYSLAEMLEPVWAGCISVSDDASKRWLADGSVGVYAWSSQARGFFTDRSGPDKTGDRELVASWYNDRNFERKRRAEEFGRRLGRSATQVAVAYCLHQPFPVVPLIGPLAVGELDDSLGALAIELTPEDVRWLEA